MSLSVKLLEPGTTSTELSDPLSSCTVSVMRFQLLTAVLASGASAARPFLNEPDTGIEEFLGGVEPGVLPNISAVTSLNDFDFAARNYLPLRNYTWFRHGAGGEWSYRNNLEAFQRFTFKHRVLTDITKVKDSLP